MTDIKKEQLVLLRFEKQIAGLAATLAAGAAVATTVDEKLAAPAGSAALADVQTALLHLAQVTSDAHAALNAKAMEAGADFLRAIPGTPKNDPVKVVLSILGLG